MVVLDICAFSSSPFGWMPEGENQNAIPKGSAPSKELRPLMARYGVTHGPGWQEVA